MNYHEKTFLTVCLLLIGVDCAQGETIGNTVYVRDAEHGGTGKEAKLASLMKSMDNIAAENGDTHAMGLVAQSCLQKKDYICAYKWSSLALTGDYFWDVVKPTPILEIRDIALEHMSDAEREKGLAQIKGYLEPKFKRMSPVPRDKTAGLSIEELRKEVEKGTIYAYGNLAKKCLEIKDYGCSFVWGTMASMGPLFWGNGEEILAVRDQARKHLSADEIKTQTLVIENHLADMKKKDIKNK